MHLLIQLFWLGLVISVALFVFSFAVTLLMWGVGLIGAGFYGLWALLTKPFKK